LEISEVNSKLETRFSLVESQFSSLNKNNLWMSKTLLWVIPEEQLRGMCNERRIVFPEDADKIEWIRLLEAALESAGGMVGCPAGIRLPASEGDDGETGAGGLESAAQAVEAEDRGGAGVVGTEDGAGGVGREAALARAGVI
jgi:hypothetical protein